MTDTEIEQDAPAPMVAADMEDGIYFGLDEKFYHSIPRLSFSGIQNILVSPATFWANSWMNPDREERDDDTDARILGRAYHAARFEPDTFDARFVRDLEKEDIPGALTTDEEIKAALSDLGQAKTKAGEKVLERAARLIDAGYDKPVWHFERMLFEDSLQDGQLAIKGKYYDQIIEDMRRIHLNPEISVHLTGGQAEVSVLYTCPDTGIRMKSRYDYLKADSYTDFKTYDNTRGKHVDQKILDDFRYNRYYIQAAGYWRTTEFIRTAALPIIGDATEDQRDLITKIRLNEDPHDVWYVFQEKNGVPNILAYRFQIFAPVDSFEPNAAGLTDEEYRKARAAQSRHTAIYNKAAIEIAHAKAQYLLYSEVYGEDQPWFPIKPLNEIGDLSYNTYFLDELPR